MASKQIATKATKATSATKAKPAAKVSTKAAANTPAKQTAKPKTAGAFSLVAGTVARIDSKHLKQALAYHVSKGNLEKVADGYKLTAQGANLWNLERVAPNPAGFQEVAAFVHGKTDAPKEYNRHPAQQVGEALRLPNITYWGSFATSGMRQAFAALFAK